MTSSTVTQMKKAEEKMRSGFADLLESTRLVHSGGGDFYFRKLNEYADALFTKFAPFKDGDQVVIFSLPENWFKSRPYTAEFMKLGATGIVQSVDYSNGLFYADVVFDRETWTSSYDNKVHEVSSKNTWGLSENHIRRTGCSISPTVQT